MCTFAFLIINNINNVDVHFKHTLKNNFHFEGRRIGPEIPFFINFQFESSWKKMPMFFLSVLQHNYDLL